MNNNQWDKLIDAVNSKLPFSPAYQMKIIGNEPYPKEFDEEVNYHGDWSDECLKPYSEIEWLKIKPRYLRHIGKLVKPELVSIEDDFIDILKRLDVHFSLDGNSILINNKRSS